MDYKKAYFELFNAITEAIDKINTSRVGSQEIEDGLEILRKAQQTTEEQYIDSEE